MTIYRLEITAKETDYGHYYTSVLSELMTRDTLHNLANDLFGESPEEALYHDQLARDCKTWTWYTVISCGSPDFIEYPSNEAEQRLRRAGHFHGDITRQVERGNVFLFYFVSY